MTRYGSTSSVDLSDHPATQRKPQSLREHAISNLHKRVADQMPEYRRYIGRSLRRLRQFPHILQRFRIAVVESRRVDVITRLVVDQHGGKFGVVERFELLSG